MKEKKISEYCEYFLKDVGILKKMSLRTVLSGTISNITKNSKAFPKYKKEQPTYLGCCYVIGSNHSVQSA